MGNFTKSDEQFMRLALQKAFAGTKKGQTPFGACVVRGHEVVCLAHNSVWKTGDITAHAEVQAIRGACKKLKTVSLADCVIYSTCEPCPMCFSACHWAGIQAVYFGASILDAQAAGFNELCIFSRQMKSLGKSPVKVFGGLLRGENAALLKMWGSHKDKKVY